MAIRPQDITRALHGLFPAVDLSTRKTGPGEFAVTMPEVTARHMGLDRGREYDVVWLSRDLGAQVRVTAVDFPPRRSWSRGPRAVITLRVQ
jgi:hypothetical protein